MDRRDPYLAFNFLVEVHGVITGGFRQVNGLESNLEIKEYAEGGRNEFLHQLPGPRRYPKLVLSRGLTKSNELWRWYNRTSLGIGTRANVTIILRDEQNDYVMWWDVLDALPVKWVGPTLHASTASDVAIESIEMVHRGIIRHDK